MGKRKPIYVKLKKQNKEFLIEIEQLKEEVK